MVTAGQEPTAAIEQGQTEVAYHCCEEWHLARLAPVCALVYCFARRISYQSRVFVCSATNLSNFFGYNERSIRRGFDQLNEFGFFQAQERALFCPTKYKVLNHEEWAEQHPGMCAVKLEYPWAGEGDPLGQRLWVESSCRIKFHDFQMQNIRSLGFTADEILGEFQAYLHQEGQCKKRENVPGGFFLYLKRKKRSRTPDSRARQQ